MAHCHQLTLNSAWDRPLMLTSGARISAPLDIPANVDRTAKAAMNFVRFMRTPLDR
ncbi:hypothetical protein VT85_11310 [Planctomyces sp. SH-PL62]|nr:hypothetical protein VT85_11310 [Planctomyces sp. SH-PL62]